MEAYTIYPIPLSERHGRIRDLFTVWFGCNLMMLTVATGALGTTIFNLPLVWAIASNAVGLAVGAIFMALHAAQGPTLGVPQMVQTRGQFGVWGAAPIIAVLIIMYIGFVASNSVLGAQSLQLAVPSIDRGWAIAIMVVLMIVPAFVGYDAIHAAARFSSWLGGVALIFCLWEATRQIGGLAGPGGHLTLAGIMSSISTGALWQIAYAPYVSDSSRYLPPTARGTRGAFWASYGGTVLGSLLPMVLGAELGVIRGHGDIAHVLGWISDPFMLPIVAILTFSLATASAMNIYCGTLSTITVVQTIFTNWKPGSSWRLVVSAGLIVVSGFIALKMAGNFLASYMAFLELLLAVLTPWTAVNLIDYYLIRHGHYDVGSFFAADGGVYGRLNIPALTAYGIGVLVQIPFLATELYTGFIAKALGRVDVSWIVGLVVSSLCYLMIARRAQSRGRDRPRLDMRVAAAAEASDSQ